MQIDERVIPSIDVSGRGGKESHLMPLLPDYKRVNESLFDFISCEGDERLEIKKQANLQWFDVGKYHNLSEADRQIKMTFLLHKGGLIRLIFYIELGEMLDILCADPKWRKHGWTKENIKTCHDQKLKFASMQAKVQLGVKKFYEKYHNKVETVWGQYGNL